MFKVIFSIAVIFVPFVAYATDPTYASVKPTFDRYCIRCHGNVAKAGGMDFQNYPYHSVVKEMPVTEVVMRALARMRAATFPMPPGGGVPVPEIEAIDAWLRNGLPD